MAPFFFHIRQKGGAVVFAESAVVGPVTGYFQWFVILESATVAQTLVLAVFVESELLLLEGSHIITELM